MNRYPPPPTTTRWPLLLLLGTAMVLCAIPAHVYPHRFMADDCYFYFQVAHEIWAGHGSTFNGVSETNGYHPLWMLGCLASMLAAGGDRMGALHVAFAIQTALAGLSMVVFTATCRRLGWNSGLLGAAVLGVAFLTGIHGSEAHVNLSAIVASAYLLVRLAQDPAERKWSIALGVALGLAVLARLDNIFVAASVGCAAAMRVWPLGPRARSGIILGGVLAVAIVGAYVATNVAWFGHATPISGAIKSTFPSADWNGAPGHFGLTMTLTAVAGLSASWFVALHSTVRTLMRAFAIGTLTHVVYVWAFTSHATAWHWYYVVGFVHATFAASMVAAWISDRLAPRLGRRAVDAGVACLAVAVAVMGVRRGWSKCDDDFVDWQSASLSVAGWLEANTEPGDRVLVQDWPGLIAYRSEASVIPLDGLIQGYDYDESLERDGIATYVREHSIAYVFAMVVPAGVHEYVPHRPCVAIEGYDWGQRLLVRTPLRKRDAGHIDLRSAGLVARFPGFVPEYEFGLWRLP